MTETPAAPAPLNETPLPPGAVLADYAPLPPEGADEVQPTAPEAALLTADPVAAAQAEAAAIIEQARREAALIAQAAREEAAAARARVADWQPQVNEPDPVPEGTNIVAEPVPNTDFSKGRRVECFVPGIKRIDF